MRTLFAVFVVAACARGSVATDGTLPGSLVGAPDACVGLACKRVTCPSGATTRLTGRVLDPAGLRGIYNVAVYVPSAPPPPVKHGARCDTCGARAIAPVAAALTDSRGGFVIDDIPADAALPVIVEMGRFRRTLTVNVPPCTETRLDDEVTRLPRSRAEGDLPLVAVTTGASDALECLLRNVGIADSEFVAAATTRARSTCFEAKAAAERKTRACPAPPTSGTMRLVSRTTTSSRSRARETDAKAMSPQQLALEFLLFDLFACVDDDRERPQPPR